MILVAFLLVSDRFPSQGLHIPPTYPSRYTTMLKLNPLTLGATPRTTGTPPAEFGSTRC